MEKRAIIDYIETSFIKDILTIKDITDISYNGCNIFITTNENGSRKVELKISHDEVKDFLRQIANIAEKQFNYLNPILDINIGRYRLNATFTSIGRVVEEESVTFSLRIASYQPRIKKDHKFMPEEVEELFDALIFNKYSIVISGVPGVGKTELQKYLISRINKNDKILIIDNTIELSSLQNDVDKNITLWQADEKNEVSSVSNLIKNGLRNNPDWMIVSEARGSDMNDLLMSAMTGVPLITTIHSLDALTAPSRMAKAIMMNEKRIAYEDVISNLNEHFKIYVHLKRYLDKKNHINRYISSIVEIDRKGIAHEIYKNNLKSKRFAKISNNLSKSLLINNKKLKFGRFMKNE